MQRARASFRQSRRRAAPSPPTSPPTLSLPRAAASSGAPSSPPPPPTAEATAELRAAVAEAKLNRAVIEARGDQTRQLQSALQQALAQIEKIEREFARFRTQAEADRALYSAVVDENAGLRARISDLVAADPGQRPCEENDPIIAEGLGDFPVTKVEEVSASLQDVDKPTTVSLTPSPPTTSSSSSPTPTSSPLSVSQSSLTHPSLPPTLSPALPLAHPTPVRCQSPASPVAVATATVTPPPLPHISPVLRRHSEAAVPLRRRQSSAQLLPLDKENHVPAPAGAGGHADRHTSAMSSSQGKPFERALSVRLLRGGANGTGSSSSGKARRTLRVPLSPVRRTQSGIVRRSDSSAVDAADTAGQAGAGERGISSGKSGADMSGSKSGPIGATAIDRGSVIESDSAVTSDISVSEEVSPARRKRSSLRWSSVSGRCF